MIRTNVADGLRLALLVAGLCGVAGAWAGPVRTIANDRAEVVYRDPAGFIDSSRFDSRTDWQGELGRYIASLAARTVPAGERLLVTITDVQRAGLPEPWRGIGWSELRVVRDTTPPRIELAFQLVTPGGAVLKEGTRTLRDNAFLDRPSLRRNEPLAYEKQLIDDWMRTDFGAPPR